jgi:hypothetical protein
LQAVLDKSITPGYGVHYDWLDEGLKAWPGLRTQSGVEALYDLWMSTDDGRVRQACGHIEGKLLVPREEVAQFLVARSMENDGNMYMMTQYVLYMAPYADLPEVMRYCASLLGDKRRQDKALLPLEGADIPQVRRVAVGALVKGMLKLGLLKENDPAFKWDVLYDEDVDRNIASIRPYLVQAGIIDPNAPYPPQPGRTRLSGELSTATPPIKGTPRVHSSPDDRTDDAPGAKAWHWLRSLGLLLVAAGLFWLVFCKRQAPDPPG